MAVSELAGELSGSDFGDVRLNRRARKLAETLGGNPSLSIPAALKTKGEIDAAYRFFNNVSVTPELICASHFKATHQRVALLDYALLIQDTTEIDLTRPAQQVKGAGMMDRSNRRGAFFHPMMACDIQGVPMGFVGQKAWVRDEISEATKAEKLKTRQTTPIEEKESYRWIEGLRWAEETAKTCPETTIVCVSDSESDIYHLFAEAVGSKQPNLHLLVRAGKSGRRRKESIGLN